MRKIVYLIHGFASPSGRGQTDRLRPFWEARGYEVIEYDYGFRGAIWLAFNNKKIAKRMAEDMKRQKASGPCLIITCSHSNGCLIVKKAADYGAPIDQAVYLAPALDKDTSIALQVKYVHVWYTPTDPATWIAKFLPWSEWGSMGSEGAKNADARFINYNRASYPVPSYTHLDIFLKKQLNFFGPLIVQEVENLVKEQS